MVLIPVKRALVELDIARYEKQIMLNPTLKGTLL
jgi:hypothetical protein